jgi:hypothetical protein
VVDYQDSRACDDSIVAGPRVRLVTLLKPSSGSSVYSRPVSGGSILDMPMDSVDDNAVDSET